MLPIDELCTSSWKGDLGKIKELIVRGVDPSSKGFVFDPNPQLIVVHPDPYQFYVRLSESIPAATNYHEKLVLTYNLKPVEQMVTDKMRAEQACPPLHYACMNNQEDAVKLLLSMGASRLNTTPL
eukprot:TRINITY_DN6272_c0_g1_i2.p1 TRINITY_DN6272_c0_g1~~TRINITY_DN6272_c0_g1_i2.p1  ORF type:complete len:125 (+),score=26.05 TRINITY_DN6272_c0_g1_i2:511-885(+)